MKTKFRPRPAGVTLIELTVVIMVLLAMTGLAIYYTGGMDKWNKGKDASDKLRSVYAAQKAYLADNPTVAVSTLNASRIIPYLPSGETSLPAVVSETGAALTFKVDVSPPVLVDGGGAVYDPSGKSNDGLWDVGL
jgi:type II secretory pathway pseudopilin PulG